MGITETRPFDATMAISRDMILAKLARLFDGYASEIYIPQVNFKQAMEDGAETQTITDCVDMIYQCIQVAMSTISVEVSVQVGRHRSLPVGIPFSEE